jgi:hypothetical protein
MKILVCGSRTWTNERVIRETLNYYRNQNPIILHGGAQGADRIAGTIADEFGFGVSVFKPDWNTQGIKAGPIRNQKMIDEKPDLVIAFYDGVSKGTMDTIRRAAKAKIPTRVVRT